MVYYNYYGPQYYYPLQAQGGPGQGDKETFGAAAMAVGAPGPFYGVRTPVVALGNHVDDKFVFAGAAQADPLMDYAYAPPEPYHLLSKYEWETTDQISSADPVNQKARAFFVHTVSHGTKIDSTKILRKGGLAYMEDESKWHRIWGKEEWIVEKFGFDVEKRLWECVQEEACRTDQAACADVKRFQAQVFAKKS
jgi:alpha 1,2-mannosyltransferase